MDKHQSLYDSIVKAGYYNRESVFAVERENGRKEFFNTKKLYESINQLEKEMLDYLKKNERILDIGAGAGRISIYLQKKGYNITALDKSDIICEILKKRGIKKVINKDIFDYYPQKRYDSVLLIKLYSIFGKKKENIKKIFRYLSQKILNKKGRIILVLNEPETKKTTIIRRRFIFREEIGPWFESIYPFSKDVLGLAKDSNLIVEKFKRNNNQYLLIFKKSETC